MRHVRASTSSTCVPHTCATDATDIAWPAVSACVCLASEAYASCTASATGVVAISTHALSASKAMSIRPRIAALGGLQPCASRRAVFPPSAASAAQSGRSLVAAAAATTDGSKQAKDAVTTA